jgi:hypothetical protein
VVILVDDVFDDTAANLAKHFPREHGAFPLVRGAP